MPTRTLEPPRAKSAQGTLAKTIAPAVAFDHVTKIYRQAGLRGANMRAVYDVSFEVNVGEVFGLLGPNRAGKTTLAKILLTLASATSGSARRFGKPASDRGTLARVGYVHERPAFPRYLSARELLLFHGRLANVSRIALRERIPVLLERFGLADRSNEPIERFSKGMVQRLCLAQSLVSDPDLLILDEPSEGLDLAGRRIVRELVEEFRDRGRTVVLISHIVSDVEALCDRVAVMAGGMLAAVGPISDFTTRSKSNEFERNLSKIYQLQQECS